MDRLGASQCVCRHGPHAHCLVITSSLFVAAAMELRRKRRDALALATLGLAVTSLGYHSTHPPEGWSWWRCADVPACYLVGTLAAAEVARTRSAPAASLLLVTLALSQRREYTLASHAGMHVCLAAGLVALP